MGLLQPDGFCSLVRGRVDERNIGKPLIGINPIRSWLCGMGGKSGRMQEALQAPTTVSPLLQPQLESVPANVIEKPNKEPVIQIRRDPSIPVG